MVMYENVKYPHIFYQQKIKGSILKYKHNAVYFSETKNDSCIPRPTAPK